jgi:radical SAM superfamily enzyme YgiQ (UPF0313 family)
MPKCLLFNTIQLKHLSRPLGAHRIAHFLREQGFDAEVVDYANFWTLDELKQLFQSRYHSSMKFVGFSHMFSLWTDTLEEFCGWIKTHYPDLKIISGSGVIPLFESKQIDYYIQGFGEMALLELLKYIDGNGSRPRFRLDAPKGKRIINANEAYPAFPMKSLLVKYEDRDFIEPREWLTIEFSRGCKFACDFCNFPVIGVKGDYTRDADDFELQMRDTYDRFGTKNYLVADETFNDRTEKIIKFANVVEKLPFESWFSGFIRADLLVSRKHEREELLRMNFLGHYYGIESFNNDSAKAVGKGMNTERLQAGLIDIKDYFLKHKRKQYRGSISLILGLPFDTYDSIEATRQWLVQNWQTQGFTALCLEIHHGEMNKLSKMSVDYKSYGYEEMTQEEVAQARAVSQNSALQQGGSHLPQILNDLVYWKNKNLDYFKAAELVEHFVDLKRHYDFRPSAFSIAHNLKQEMTMNERLSLSGDYYHLLDDNLQNYKNKKLNWVPA